MLGLDTPLKQAIFAGYVSLWVASHLLVYSSQRSGEPPYNTTSVVLLTELTKFCIALALYLTNDGDIGLLAMVVKKSWLLFAKYSVPALLYCFYNNLVYINLTAFDPGTYNVLMQLKIVLTAVIYQILFSKQLNRNKWYAIFLITAGCMVKESNKLFAASEDEKKANMLRWLLLLFQLSCSVFAGVYNEALLKDDGGPDTGVTTNVQNMFMYIQSVFWNAIFLMIDGKLGEAISPSNMSAVFSIRVLAIMAIMSSVGIVTGFFLKHLDSVLKAIAGAVEIVFTMVFAFIFFGTPMDALALAAAVLVGAGVALYSKPQLEVPRIPVKPAVDAVQAQELGAINKDVGDEEDEENNR
eukprot:TRINITY_DN97004_c0_g1_i1.p1 TRINITY_DN97004_c0_g1~~TRINITY_DN97004_c0_g1_i1.p1  ORF type:complete len:354 (-),score=50.93 TRINITY_DN97004_c0_g1_i1:211-1272(-)